MSTAIAIDVPVGTWSVDPIHSNAHFEVEHSSVSVFRGAFKPVDARLVADESGLALEGAVDVASISVEDENLRPHLLSPDFFDADRNPDVSFRSTEITGEQDDLRVKGELTMAGVTLPVEARGRLRGPLVGPGDVEKLAISLEASIDRTQFGMDWQMDLPGGGTALANEVKLLVDLEFGRA